MKTLIDELNRRPASPEEHEQALRELVLSANDSVRERPVNPPGAEIEDDGAEQLIELEQIAAKLAVSERTVWREVADGQLPQPIYVRDEPRWFVADLREYLNNRRQQRGKKIHRHNP